MKTALRMMAVLVLMLAAKSAWAQFSGSGTYLNTSGYGGEVVTWIGDDTYSVRWIGPDGEIGTPVNVSDDDITDYLTDELGTYDHFDDGVNNFGDNIAEIDFSAASDVSIGYGFVQEGDQLFFTGSVDGVQVGGSFLNPDNFSYNLNAFLDAVDDLSSTDSISNASLDNLDHFFDDYQYFNDTYLDSVMDSYLDCWDDVVDDFGLMGGPN